MALQQELGLLPHRGVGSDPSGSDRSSPPGSALIYAAMGNVASRQNQGLATAFCTHSGASSPGADVERWFVRILGSHA